MPNTVATVGIIGIGRIGLPVAANLVRSGYRVLAHDIRPELADAARARGVGWAESARAAVVDAHTVLTVLPGSPELRALMLGGEALLGELAPRTTWIDLTSASPELGEQLAAAASANAIGYLDAPVGGGAPAAQSGSLSAYVGGPPELLSRCRPVLDAFATSVYHLGASGSGYLTKLLINLLWFGQAVATGEILPLARTAGIDPGRLREAIMGGAASSEFARTYLPLYLDGDRMSGFGLDRCVEELDSIERFARAKQTPFELSSVIVRLHRAALEYFGPVDGELMALAYLQDMAEQQGALRTAISGYAPTDS